MEQNYLPLFRKYRPQSFKDIVGQENLVKALTNAIELNRIANAYLFCGPRGTGKTSSARIFAKSLNCECGPTLEPCQKCASCVDITNTTGLDVIEIDAASNRGIQDAKDLIAQVQYAPINGKYKIFIIDEVHMLTPEAFNALLKTLEEPPKNVIFILATTEPHKVLETIVSRCQRFDLRRITVEDIIKRLREISNIENIKITDDALYSIAKNVSGGLRDSLALLDQVSILGIKEEITKDLIEELLGKINFNILLDLLKNIDDENIEKAVFLVNEIYQKGNEPRNLAENFIEFLRNIILIMNASDSQEVKNFTTLIDEDIEKIKNSNFDKDKIIKILNIFVEYYKEIKISTNPYLWMELGVIASCKLNLSISNKKEKPINPKEAAIKMQEPIKPSFVNDVLETKNQKQIEEPTLNSSPTPSQQPKEVPTRTSSVVPPNIAENQDSAQIWANILGAISSIPARARYSGTAKLIGIKNNIITLGFINEDTLNEAKSPNKLNLLNKAIESTYPDYKVEFIKITSDTKYIAVKPSVRQAKPQPNNSVPIAPVEHIQKPEKIETDSQNETSDENIDKKNYSPKVQEMLEQFNGKIID